MAASPGWKLNGPKLTQTRAVDRTAEVRQQREDQQRDRGEAERVGKGLQPAVVAHQHKDPRERDDADRRPDQLGVGERGAIGVDLLTPEVEAIDHRETQPVEGDDQRQEDGVRVGRDPADDQVRRDRDDDQCAAELVGVGRDRALDAEPDRCVGRDADEHGQHGQEELGSPPFARNPGGCGHRCHAVLDAVDLVVWVGVGFLDGVGVGVGTTASWSSSATVFSASALLEASMPASTC